MHHRRGTGRARQGIRLVPSVRRPTALTHGRRLANRRGGGSPWVTLTWRCIQYGARVPSLPLAPVLPFTDSARVAVPLFSPASTELGRRRRPAALTSVRRKNCLGREREPTARTSRRGLGPEPCGFSRLAVRAIDGTRHYRIAKRLLENGKDPDPALVADPGINLKSLLRWGAVSSVSISKGLGCGAFLPAPVLLPWEMPGRLLPRDAQYVEILRTHKGQHRDRAEPVRSFLEVRQQSAQRTRLTRVFVRL